MKLILDFRDTSLLNAQRSGIDFRMFRLISEIRKENQWKIPQSF